MTNYVISEQDVARTLSDFNIFCTYLAEHRPSLTKARQELGKKDCFAIDSLLSRSRNFDGPKYLQTSYPTIHFLFHIAVTTSLFIPVNGKGESLVLIPSPLLADYNSLNPMSKYLFLFQAYWAKLDWNELYFDTMTMFNHFMYTKLAFVALADATPGTRIFANVEDFYSGYDRKNPVHKLFVGAGLVVDHLRALGFWEYEEAHIPTFHTSKRDIDVKAITPTALGISMMRACLERPYELYNEHRDEEQIQRNWQEEHIAALAASMGIRPPLGLAKTEPFAQAFLPMFPAGTIDTKAIDEIFYPPKQADSAVEGNVYVFKVSLDKQVWRTITASASHSLHHLHQAIQAAFNFADDHLYAFFMDGKAWSKEVFWAKETGDKPVATRAIIGNIGLRPGQKILYLFDFGDEWEFNVQVTEISHSPSPPFRPLVIAGKGEAPDQYADWDWDE